MEHATAGNADAQWQEGVAEHYEGQDISGLVRSLADGLRRDPASWPPEVTHETSHARMEWFLGKFGREGLRSVLAAMGTRGVEGGLRSVTGLSSAELDEAWAADLAAERR